MVLYFKQQIDLKEDSMNHEESIQKLTAYHAMPKEKIGIAYFSIPLEPVPEPEVKNPNLIDPRIQGAQAYWNWRKPSKKIHRK